MVAILIMVTILHMVASSDHGHFDNDLAPKIIPHLRRVVNRCLPLENNSWYGQNRDIIYS